MGPTWGPPGSCRPQMGLMLAPWTLLSGSYYLSLEQNDLQESQWSADSHMHDSVIRSSQGPSIVRSCQWRWVLHWTLWLSHSCLTWVYSSMTGIVMPCHTISRKKDLCMPPANERWHYILKSSLIGWAHTKMITGRCGIHHWSNPKEKI